MRFRLLTYNIHKGIGGLDRRYDLARTIETIRHYQPDVALLQEVDEGAKRSRHDRQVDLLAEAVELPYRAYQRNVRLRTVGHYGNAVLSRWPILEPEDLDLTIRFKKRRGALLCRFRAHVGEHTRTVVLANVHLGLAGFERQIQLKRLLACGHVCRLHGQTPLIVAGDFNDVWDSLGKRVMQPAGFRLGSGHVRTFPAAAPLRRLDRVFYRGSLAAIGAFAGHTGAARRASDHLPVIVDFEVLDHAAHD
ncbi:MAG: endonuclease [Planctomycetota bacterium]|nr:MAG: endonuclease [Planctomycetota bacterium]